MKCLARVSALAVSATSRLSTAAMYSHPGGMPRGGSAEALSLALTGNSMTSYFIFLI